MQKYSIEDIVEKYKNKSVTIISNGPSVMSRDGKTPALSASENNLTVIDSSNIHGSIWCLNGGWAYHPKCELGFNIDDLGFSGWKNEPNIDWYLGKIKNAQCPILTSHVYEEYDSLVKFPLQQIVDFFDLGYFAESMNYMTSFAIYCGVKDITYYGADYTDQYLYPSERASNEYWIGQANARGIKTFIDKKYSSLISAPPRKEHVLGFYGYKKETFDLKVDYKIETGDPYYEQYIKDRFDIIKDVYSSFSKEYFDIRNKKLKKIRKKR